MINESIICVHEFRLAAKDYHYNVTSETQINTDRPTEHFRKKFDSNIVAMAKIVITISDSSKLLGSAILSIKSTLYQKRVFYF